MTELGPKNAVREFGSGALIGFGLFAGVIAILWMFGIYQVNGYEIAWLAPLGTLAGAITSAFAQELIFRGVFLAEIQGGSSDNWKGPCQTGIRGEPVRLAEGKTRPYQNPRSGRRAVPQPDAPA